MEVHLALDSGLEKLLCKHQKGGRFELELQVLPPHSCGFVLCPFVFGVLDRLINPTDFVVFKKKGVHLCSPHVATKGWGITDRAILSRL